MWKESKEVCYAINRYFGKLEWYQRGKGDDASSSVMWLELRVDFEMATACKVGKKTTLTVE